MVTHLHVRSCFTLLQSSLKPEEIVKYANQNKMKRIALVDKNIMFGAMPFYHACKREEVQPIFGLEIDCVYEENIFQFIIYAKNDEGYQQLLKLSSFINIRKEMITLDKLQSFDKGVIITSAGDNDTLQSYLLHDDKESLHSFLEQCQDRFQSFYIAISMNDSGLLKIKNDILKEVAASLSLKTFALSRIYYGGSDEEEAYKVLCAIQQQKTLDDPTLSFSSKRYFRSEEEMRELYSESELQVCEEIADACQVTMSFPKMTLPKFKNKYEVDSDMYLRNLCKKGLVKRLDNKIEEEYVKRLTYELDVITSMGFSDYFLIVYDFIRFAKTKQIYVGPGRGSAAGSLVSYCLGITHVDPIAYELLFERFLNPERISMPDVDIDFPDDRRQEVIDYVKEVYGDKHVAHIVTFNTLAARQVIRDVGRVLNISIREVDMLSKMIPSTPKITLEYAYDNVGNFKQTILASKKYMHLYEIAKKLEGLPRHVSTHAAGIVLAQAEIDEVCPLIQVEEDVLSTQFTMEYLEDLGLIKMDFLGLRNLTIIDEVCRQVNTIERKPLDIMHIPLDDQKTFSLIQEADTMGVFQLESDGMKNLIRKMRPTCFEEIVAAIALFRPGPMENIPLYLENRENTNTIDYIHADLKNVLSNTYGVMIYQEQIMKVVQIMANFSLGKADILRKAISKKKSAELTSLREAFIQGALKNGYEETLANQVYDLIMKFAGYGFNRSHSVAYGLIAYQLAYLKANKPLPFFASLLNSVIGSEIKTSEYIFEARKRKITVLHPSVNQSESTFTIEQGALRFPLLNIKGVGSAAFLQLVEERNNRGIFVDYFDFVARISTRKISRKIIESLIDAGALDEFKVGRLCMKASLDDALRYASLVSIEEKDQINIDLNLVSKPSMTIVSEDVRIISENEKTVLGFYLSKHPINDIRLLYPNSQSLIELKEKQGFVKLVCFIERVKEHRTKNGDLMCFISASDETFKMDLVCMPNIYSKHKDALRRGTYLYVEGKIDYRQSCLVNTLQIITL